MTTDDAGVNATDVGYVTDEGRRFLGIELKAAYYNVARRNLQGAASQLAFVVPA